MLTGMVRSLPFGASFRSSSSMGWVTHPLFSCTWEVIVHSLNPMSKEVKGVLNWLGGWQHVEYVGGYAANSNE